MSHSMLAAVTADTLILAGAAVVAALLGAIIGVIGTLRAVRYTVRLSEKERKSAALQDRKLNVFRTLLATRSAKLHALRIEALNLVIFEFREVESVRSAFTEHNSHLRTTEPTEEQAARAWADREHLLLAKLLHAISKSLDLGYTLEELSTEGYQPIAIWEQDQHQRAIRTGLCNILVGNAALRVTPVNLPATKL